MAGPSGPNAAAQTVGRLPATTLAVPGGGPFIRYSYKSQQDGYDVTGQAFGASITQPLTATPGFLSALIVKVNATGGTGATVVTAAGDAPWNAISQLTLRDAQGQPIYPAIDGYGLFLINLYSGQCGQAGQQDPSTLADYSAVQTTSGSGAGNFTFKLWVPLQFNSSGYCSLPADNSAELPKLQIVLAGSATVYTTAPATLPTMEVQVNEEYNSVPNNLSTLAPYDPGASAQWTVVGGSAGPPSNAYLRIQDPAVGQFVHTKILVFRDSNSARQNDFPATFEYYVDSFNYLREPINDRYDKMKKAFNVTRPTGVIALSYRDSLQTQVSSADDSERILVTNGATKLEYGGTWATNANTPATLTIYTGFIFPGREGWPYGSQGQ